MTHNSEISELFESLTPEQRMAFLDQASPEELEELYAAISGDDDDQQDADESHVKGPVAKALEKGDIKYDQIADDLLRVIWSSDDNKVAINVIISDDDTVALRTTDLASFEESSALVALKTVSKLNNQYRFTKFCIDESDNTIHVEMDVCEGATEEGALGTMFAVRTVARICLGVLDEGELRI